MASNTSSRWRQIKEQTTRRTSELEESGLVGVPCHVPPPPLAAAVAAHRRRHRRSPLTAHRSPLTAHRSPLTAPTAPVAAVPLDELQRQAREALKALDGGSKDKGCDPLQSGSGGGGGNGGPNKKARTDEGPPVPPAPSSSLSSSSSSSSSASASSSSSSSPVPRAMPLDLVPLPPERIQVGSFDVPAIGLGTIALGVTYSGGGRPTKSDSIAVLREAIRLGIRYFDTADTYCAADQCLNGVPVDVGYCEGLLFEAMAASDAAVAATCVVATKGQSLRAGPESRDWQVPPVMGPVALKQRIRASASRLGGVVDVWQWHHTDAYPLYPATEFLAAIEAVKECKEAGLVKEVGMCNCSTKHIEVAIGAGLRPAVVQVGSASHVSIHPTSRRRTTPRRAAPRRYTAIQHHHIATHLNPGAPPPEQVQPVRPGGRAGEQPKGPRPVQSEEGQQKHGLAVLCEGGHTLRAVRCPRRTSSAQRKARPGARLSTVGVYIYRWMVRDFPRPYPMISPCAMYTPHRIEAMARSKGVSAHALVLAAMRHKWWVRTITFFI